MKNKNRHIYSSIKSFEDFKIEKDRLLIKKEIIEARIKLSFKQFSHIFSISNTIFSISKDFILPSISSLLSWLLKKVEKQETQ